MFETGRKNREWIPIPRNFPDWFDFYKDHRCVQLFLYLLVTANSMQDDVDGTAPVYRGTVRKTYRELQEYLQMSREQLRWCIKKLSRKYIYVESDSTRSTRFTIRGYGQFNSTILSQLGGWVRLYKDFAIYPWFEKPDVCCLYVSLLVRQNDVHCEVSIQTLSQELCMTKAEVMKCMRCLMKFEILSCEKRKRVDTARIEFQNKQFVGLSLPARPGFEKVLSANQTTTKELPKGNQGCNNIENYRQPGSGSKEDYKPNSYNGGQPNSNQRLTKEPHNIKEDGDANGNYKISIGGNSTSYNILKNKKEKDIIKANNNSCAQDDSGGVHDRLDSFMEKSERREKEEKEKEGKAWDSADDIPYANNWDDGVDKPEGELVDSKMNQGTVFPSSSVSHEDDGIKSPVLKSGVEAVTVFGQQEARERELTREASSCESWKEVVMLSFKIKDKKKIDTLLQDFLNWVLCTRDTHDGLGEYQKHFTCWLRNKERHGELNDEYQNISVYGYHGNNIPSWDTDAQQEFMQQRRQASTTRLMEEIVRQGAASGGGGSLGW